jgi:hypothetical protein
VVEGDWEKLRKYNLSELYAEALQENGSSEPSAKQGVDASAEKVAAA